MRVLIVSPSYLPEIGAAPSRITNMAEGLSGLGIKVDVLTCLPNYPKGRIFDGYRGAFSKTEDVNGGLGHVAFSLLLPEKGGTERLRPLAIVGRGAGGHERGGRLSWGDGAYRAVPLS